MDKQKKISKWMLFSVTLLLCVGVFVCDGLNSQARSEKVRVGIYQLKGFYERNEKGELSGYGIDYLEKIAELTGWEYRYIWADSWEECKELLREGKVDIIAPAKKMEEEETAELAYSSFSIGMESGVLLTLDANEKLIYEDYKSFDNMTIGCEEALIFKEDLIVYAEKNNFSLHFIFYKNTKEAVEALREGKTDAILLSLFDKTGDMKILANLGAHPIYFMLNRNETELIETLNETLQTIQTETINFDGELMEKYYPDYNHIPFSKSELEYIAGVPVMRVACRSNMKPVSYVDDKTGEVAGINRKILDKISEISGLQFEYVSLPEGDIDYKLLRSLNVSLISQVEYNKENERLSSLRMTKPYLNTQKVFVCSAENVYKIDSAGKLAVSTGSGTLLKEINRIYPNLEIINYDNVAACFEAVRTGEADVLLQNQYVIAPYLAKPLYKDMMTIPVEQMDDIVCLSPLSYGVNSEKVGYLSDKRLISILNKSISQIDQETVEKIIIEETVKNQYVYTWKDFMYQYRYFFIIMGAVLIVLGILIGVIIAMRRKNEKILKENEKKHEILLENSGDIIFEVDYLKKQVKVSGMFEKKFGWKIPADQTFQSLYDIPRMLKCYEGDKGTADKIVKQLLEEKKNVENLVRIMKTDGTFLWCKIAQYPMLNSKGGMVYIMGKILDVDKEIREREDLMKMSRVDTLTGLLNKMTFFKEIEKQLEEEQGNCCLIFIDVDNFKQINDTFGHMTGDEVIKETAEKLTDIFEDGGILSRFGGDEFCIYISEITEKELQERLQCIVERLQSVYSANGKTVACSASVGAVYATAKGKKLEALIEDADGALYQAKEKGKNQYIIC